MHTKYGVIMSPTHTRLSAQTKKSSEIPSQRIANLIREQKIGTFCHIRIITG